MTELLRFFAVTVLGVVLDITIAFVLAEHFGMPLWIAATIGFVIAASMNYVIHQTWSFRSGPRGVSARRAVQYAGVALATLLARISVVAAIDAMLDDGLALFILVCGAGVSFFVNFTLSKFVVFAPAAPGEEERAS